MQKLLSVIIISVCVIIGLYSEEIIIIPQDYTCPFMLKASCASIVKSPTTPNTYIYDGILTLQWYQVTGGGMGGASTYGKGTVSYWDFDTSILDSTGQFLCHYQAANYAFDFEYFYRPSGPAPGSDTVYHFVPKSGVIKTLAEEYNTLYVSGNTQIVVNTGGYEFTIYYEGPITLLATTHGGMGEYEAVDDEYGNPMRYTHVYVNQDFTLHYHESSYPTYHFIPIPGNAVITIGNNLITKLVNNQTSTSPNYGFTNWLPVNINGVQVDSQTLSISASSLSGVSTVKYLLNTSPPQSGTGSSVVLPEGNYSATVTVTDNAGFTKTATYQVKYDKTLPTVTFTPSASKKSWIFYASDGNSNLNPAVGINYYQVRYSPTPIVISKSIFNSLQLISSGAVSASSQEISAGTADGYYYLFVHAQDNAGNILETLSASDVVENNKPLCIDSTPPTFNTQPVANLNIQGNVTLSWAENSATDATSGVDLTSYQAFYWINDATVLTTIPTNIGSQEQAYLDTSNLKNQLIHLVVKVSDNSGNQAVSEQIPLFIPGQISLSLSSNLHPVDPKTMGVNISFGLTAFQLKNGYPTLSINRVSSNGLNLDPLNIAPSTIALDENGVLIPTAPWHIDPNTNNVVYEDAILIGSGAGNKVCTYSIALPNVAPCGILLPNNKGDVQISIRDMNDVPYGDPKFGGSADGNLKVVLQASDVDSDTLTAEIDKITQFAANGTPLLRASARLGPVSALPYSPIAPVGYKAVVQVITLREGDSFICPSWNEPNDPALYNPDSPSFKKISLTKKSSGSGFDIRISDANAPDNSSIDNMTVQPGQPLTFSYTVGSGTNPSVINWHFDDGSEDSPNGTHTYHQLSDQVGNSETHNLTLTVTNDDGSSSSTTLPIIVMDTQVGALFEAEHWRGSHTVTGVVLVNPVNFDPGLAIQSDAVVSFEGSPTVGYNQGITVNGSATLTIASGAVLQSGNIDNKLWGTLLIKGSAIIGAATISNAQRAIVVARGAVVRLAGTNIHDNGIGIQLVGASDTIIDSCSFKNNSEYGIKEEIGATPVVTNNTFAPFRRNYYSYKKNLVPVTTLQNGNKEE